MIGGIAEMMDDLNSAVADLMNIANPNGATGAFLTNISALTNVKRNSATAKCHYIGTPGTAVPYTFTVQSTADGSSWKPSQAPAPQVTIGVDGTAAGTLACTTAGGLTSPLAGTWTDITTLMAGIDAVTNDLGTIDGDPSLRIRRQLATAIATQSMGDVLLAALLAIPHRQGRCCAGERQ